MNTFIKIIFISLFVMMCLFVSACTEQAETSQVPKQEVGKETKTDSKSEKPKKPNLQAELLDGKDATTESVIGDFDFKNFTYPLPRGWQDADSKEITLENGKRNLDMSERKIGMEYVTTKFFDITGNGEDEAVVILKVLTGSITIPQNVYIFEWKGGTPKMMWNFRTGDRADGGLKKIYLEEGKLAIELFGRDRYIFGQMETSKIVGDEQNLCCPSHWTKSLYKFAGNRLVLDSDRLTYSMQDFDEEPVKNMNELLLKEERGS